MTVNPEEVPDQGALFDMWLDLHSRVDPHIEQIKFVRGHGDHKGWSLKQDEDGDSRFQCACGEWLDDKEADDA